MTVQPGTPVRFEVIVSQHVNKTAGRESGKSALHQGGARGSTGFTNAARWQFQMVTPSEKDAKARKIDPDHLINRYIWAKVVKKNVGFVENPFLLKRDINGILRLQPTATPVSPEQEVLGAVVDKIAELEGAGMPPYTIRKFCETFKGTWEGFGKTKLKQVVQSAIDEGRLFIRPAKNRNGRAVDGSPSIGKYSGRCRLSNNRYPDTIAP